MLSIRLSASAALCIHPVDYSEMIQLSPLQGETNLGTAEKENY